MTWSTYVGEIHLESRPWFFIQRVDENHMQSGDNGVVRNSSGRTALYETEAAARAHGREWAEPLQDKSPFIVDIDSMLAWCSKPNVKTLDATLALSAWHLLIDLGVCEEFPDALRPKEAGYELSVVVDKVHDTHWVNGDPEAKRPLPMWRAGELSLLAETLKAGIQRLGSEILPCSDQQ
jgi:hypothetical protein